MMVVVSEAKSDVGEPVDPPSAVLGRLEAFGVEVLAEAMNRPVQMVNRGLYPPGADRAGCA
jgi:hypothetical protein